MYPTLVDLEIFHLHLDSNIQRKFHNGVCNVAPFLFILWRFVVPDYVHLLLNLVKNIIYHCNSNSPNGVGHIIIFVVVEMF